jgi:hypothetical protein
VLHLVTDLRLGGTQAILLERVRRPGPFRHAVLCFADRTGANAENGVPGLAAAFASAGAEVLRLGLRTPGHAVLALLVGRIPRRLDALLAARWPQGRWVAMNDALSLGIPTPLRRLLLEAMNS